jgi:hypothetical protein
MIPKSVNRFSERIMRWQRMIPKSGNRFSERIMRRQPMIAKSGNRFSEKIMRWQIGMIAKSAVIRSKRIAP